MDPLFSRAVEQLDREHRRLLSLDPVGQVAAFDHDGFLATNRALSYVVMGGVLEDLMRQLPQGIAADVVALGIERRVLPPSLIAVIETAIFRQCGADNVSSLIARAELVNAVVAHQFDARPISDFGDLFKLADGQTINEKNFKAVWALLGLSGDWKNDANDTLLLREIREKRNDVAHWLEDPVDIGRSKRPSDLRQMVKRLIDLVQHFQLSLWLWFEEKAPLSSRE